MKPEGQRIFGLDIFRALAILFVLQVHLWSVIGDPASRTLLKAKALGFNGVNVFFVLSGYLIGFILLRTLHEKGSSLKSLTSFWRDRWLRTLPAYYCVLIAIMTILMIYAHQTIQHFQYLFLFSQNLKGNEYNLFAESWSLAVEEWFYFIVPILLFMGTRMMPVKKAVPVVIIMVFLFSNMIRVYRAYKYGIGSVSPATDHLMFTKISTSVPARIDNIMFGILGAYLSFYRFRVWTNYKNLLFVVGIIGYCCNHFYKAFTEPNLYNVLFQGQVELLFILMTFPKVASIQKGEGVVARAITFISTISYSIYLVHLSLFVCAVMPRFPKNPWIILPVYFLWAFAGGYLLHNTVEKWGLKYRAKLRQRAALKEAQAATIPRSQIPAFIKCALNRVYSRLCKPG